MDNTKQVKSENHPAEQGIRAVVLGIIANLTLVIAKGLAGIFGNSYALIADAIESLTDVFSSMIVWWGLKLSAKPADDKHPLGHGKAEPLAALTVGMFLLAAAALVAWQSVQEIMLPHLLPAPWTLLVLVVVMAVKTLLSRYSRRTAQATGSLAVEGDAWHHLSDAISSGAAFIGISVALLGSRINPNPNWASADDWAALVAAAVIAVNGFSIIRSSLDELLDAHPGTELEDEIKRIAAQVPGVVNLHNFFVRKQGFDYFVDMDVRVDRNLPVYRGHEIAHAVQDAVRNGLPNLRIARVLVHIEPAA